MDLLILCLKIFSVRILDVSLGTIRTIITVKGKNLLASMIGFVEVFVWFVIVKEALNTDSTSIFVAISYALGFATGTYIGGILSDKYVKGEITVQIVTDNKNMIDSLKSAGFGVTSVDTHSKKIMIIVEIEKSRFDKLRKLIKKNDSNSFVIVNETKSVYNGYFEK